MKYAGEFRGKSLVFLGMILIAAYMAAKACEPVVSPDKLPAAKHSTGSR